MASTSRASGIPFFAYRSFLNPADGDYIAARLAHRAMLPQQYLWIGHQAIEKYLKCILLLHRKNAKFAHKILCGIERIENECPFDFRLSNDTREYLFRLHIQGEYQRYFEMPYHVRPRDLLRLDQAVWEIRRYCTILDEKLLKSLPKAERKKEVLNQINKIFLSDGRHPFFFRLGHGLVDEILNDPGHPSRSALVWQNVYFSGRPRYRIRPSQFWRFAKPALMIAPRLLDEVSQYVTVSSDVKKRFRRLQRELAKSSKSKRF